jgi:transposase
MSCIVPVLPFAVKEKMKRRFRSATDAGVRLRYLMIFNLWNGRSGRQTAEVLNVHNTTVYRVAERFRERGEASLWDGREENGQPKLSPDYLGLLDRVVRSKATEHGWLRPTWTREMLVKTMARKTGIAIHVTTMSRALAAINARRGRPRPRVSCPWHPAKKTRRLNELRRLAATLPKNEALLYEDEVDIHLNPKIGLDWMGKSQQKEVMTPGKNEKRYLAGALDARTGALHWVEGMQKNSWLFMDLLKKLTIVYAKAKIIHVILDNYGIHSSTVIGIALCHFARRIRLHPLPPYCPDDNKIERLWQDLHANVTRNHCCATMDDLMSNVRKYLRRRTSVACADTTNSAA